MGFLSELDFVYFMVWFGSDSYSSNLFLQKCHTAICLQKSCGRKDSKQPKSSASVEERFLFSLLVMSSWDHSITSSEASYNLSKGITSVLKDNLYEAKAMAESQKRSKRDKYKVYACRLLAWFFTM
ncbi:hypothetical protein KUTeg_008818 [Tegillarca granosa]|uniref:Uncharacterized protein n=1 Tax=Tegillarca granosa TaxID=220873 RepID=A0ABQ9FA89_TEGGR|nr:hypothetical protein KUTeg_008818 [Tegillarca granosa]